MNPDAKDKVTAINSMHRAKYILGSRATITKH